MGSIAQDIGFRPFANGSQFADWEASNCDRCTKSGDGGERGSSQCEIFEALWDADCTDGRITPDIARRMAFIGNETRYVWPCSEVEWTPAYLNEWARKRGYPDFAAWQAEQAESPEQS